LSEIASSFEVEGAKVQTHSCMFSKISFVKSVRQKLQRAPAPSYAPAMQILTNIVKVKHMWLIFILISLSQTPVYTASCNVPVYFPDVKPVPDYAAW